MKVERKEKAVELGASVCVSGEKHHRMSENDVFSYKRTEKAGKARHIELFFPTAKFTTAASFDTEKNCYRNR